MEIRQVYYRHMCPDKHLTHEERATFLRQEFQATKAWWCLVPFIQGAGVTPDWEWVWSMVVLQQHEDAFLRQQVKQVSPRKRKAFYHYLLEKHDVDLSKYLSNGERWFARSTLSPDTARTFLLRAFFQRTQKVWCLIPFLEGRGVPLDFSTVYTWAKFYPDVVRELIQGILNDQYAHGLLFLHYLMERDEKTGANYLIRYYILHDEHHQAYLIAQRVGLANTCRKVFKTRNYTISREHKEAFFRHVRDQQEIVGAYYLGQVVLQHQSFDEAYEYFQESIGFPTPEKGVSTDLFPTEFLNTRRIERLEARVKQLEALLHKHST